MAAKIAFFLSLLLILISGKSDYSDCKWFGGNETNVPLYPIDICTAHSHETELDNLFLYSTKYECNDNGEIEQAEWNNTDCYGKEYNRKIYRKEDGYYFNCDALTSCPFTKIILWELQNITDAHGHNEHICAFDMQHYYEISIVTNICIDLLEEYNVSFYIDCDANSVTYSEYSDADCKKKKYGLGDDEDLFTIDEGCDDPFDMNAFVQIAECDDANYNPSNPTIVPSYYRTNAPSSNPTNVPSSYRTNAPSSHPTNVPSPHPTNVPSSGSNIGGSDTEKRHEDITAVVFTIGAGIIVIIFVIIIGFYLVNRRIKTAQVAATNIDQQAFNVDFQSIGDVLDGDRDGDERSNISNNIVNDPQPDTMQQITTQGQDIQEITIASNHQHVMR